MEQIDENLHMSLLDFDITKRKDWVDNRKPFSTLFELTAQCNMKCIHCYLQNDHMSKQLSYQDIKKIIDILYDKGILFLTLTGGEILIRPDFIDIYLYAKKKGFLVELFTNGYLFTDEIIEILKQYPPLLVDVSIYGACEDTYYKVTGIRGAFNKVIVNCKKLKDAGIRVSLKTPILTATLGELQSMKSLAKRLGIIFVHTFDICATIDRDTHPKNLQVPIETALQYEFENYYEQLSQNTSLNHQDNTQIINELMKNEYLYSCNVAINSFVIDYLGRMCPCMKLRHKGIKLELNNYDYIWESFRKYSQLKASELYICKGCDAKYYCDVCPAEMDFLYEDAEYRSESFCKYAKIRKDFYEKKLTFEEALQMSAFNK